MKLKIHITREDFITNKHQNKDKKMLGTFPKERDTEALRELFKALRKNK